MIDRPERPTILCISTYLKGQAFLREAARHVDVVLLTVDGLVQADWPRDVLADFVTMPEEQAPAEILNRMLLICRARRIGRIVALDEFDLEAAALAREHLRLPGMGESATRFFRDKLAMRVGAQKAGVAVPEFTGVFNYDDLRSFMAAVPGPWLLKPRTNASAIGIKRIEAPEQLWRTLDELGDVQSHYLLERFLPGDVFHVEGIVWEGEMLFSKPFRYGQPPIETMHQGGVFTTRGLPEESSEAQELSRVHRDVLKGLGMVSGVNHTEFIRAAHDGRFYFLETAARVGGAYIAEVVEFATGINPWVEWAQIEVAALLGAFYRLPPVRGDYAGSVICLARQETPDTSAYDAPEVVYRLTRHHHAGLIVKSASAGRVGSLIDEYGKRFLDEFCAVEPAPDKPTA